MNIIQLQAEILDVALAQVTQNVPAAISIIGAIFTALGALITGWLTYKSAQSKNMLEGRQLDRTAEAQLRDDLIETVKAYDTRMAQQDTTYNERFIKQDSKIIGLQDEIYKLKTENLTLLQENLKLQARVRELEVELSMFHNKVFYVRPPTQPVS